LLIINDFQLVQLMHILLEGVYWTFNLIITKHLHIFWEMFTSMVSKWWKHIGVDHNGWLKFHFENPYLVYFNSNDASKF
jgi:hypothetical protein